MSRVFYSELSFVEWQECTCKVSIDTIHKTPILPLLSRWHWFQVLSSFRKVELESRTSPDCFTNSGIPGLGPEGPSCGWWAPRKGPQMVIRQERWIIPIRSPTGLDQCRVFCDCCRAGETVCVDSYRSFSIVNQFTFAEVVSSIPNSEE